MLIEYVAFGALVAMALVATFVGMRRRRADMLSGEPTVTFPYTGDGSAGTEATHHTGLEGSLDGGGGAQGGGFDGGGESHGGGGFDSGGGQHH